jgi:hypothetical protein
VRAFLDKWAPWIAVAVLVAGVGAYAATRIGSGSGDSTTTTTASLPSVPPEPKELAIAKEFVATAVARKQLARAWALAAPEMKQGLTLKQWLTGTIPVTPYPVGKAAVKFTVQSSTADDAVIRVSFLPPPASATPGGDFLITLHRDGGNWLVTSWVPRQAVNAPSGG